MVLKMFLIIACLLLPFAVYGSVIINEITWMGTNVSYNDEWIELYNTAENDINLDGWILKAGDGSPEINLSGTIPAKGFYLLERTDDETIPGISADLIYTGALGNNGENLNLYNSSGNLIDEVICTDTWPAGDNSTKQTMERTISGNWQTSQNPGGTPKVENSKLEEVEEDGPMPTPEEKPTEDAPLTAEPASYPKGIIFNEILPSPDGPDAENEWIELYNQNDFEVDLNNWTIQDTTGSAKTYALNAKIPALGYLVLKRPETKITLNNDGDGLNLFNPNEEIVDSVDFGKAFQNQSYSKTSSGWAWNSNLTPGEKNIISVKQASSTAKTTEKQKELSEDRPLTAESADINLSTQKSKPPVWLIALIVAILSAGVVIYLNNLLSSHNHSGRGTQNQF